MALQKGIYIFRSESKHQFSGDTLVFRVYTFIIFLIFVQSSPDKEDEPLGKGNEVLFDQNYCVWMSLDLFGQ